MSFLEQLKAARQAKGIIEEDNDEPWKTESQRASNILCCGAGRYGRVGRNHEENQGQLLPVLCERSFSSVAVGAAHLAAICDVNDEASVYTWGKCHVGQLGHGDMTRDAFAPRKVAGLSGVSSVRCGLSHVLARCGDNDEVYAWGMGYYHCLGLDDEKHRTRPCLVSGKLPPIADMDGGRFHSVFVSRDSGQLFACGGEEARLGSPLALPLRHVLSVSAGHDSSAALTLDGRVHLVQGDACRELVLPEGAQGDQVSLRGSALTVVTTRGELLSQGAVPHAYREFAGDSWSRVSIRDDSGHQQVVTEVSMGHYHTMALTAANAVYSWGENSFGALGHGPIPKGYNITRERPISDGFCSAPTRVVLPKELTEASVKQLMCGSSVSAILL